MNWQRFLFSYDGRMRRLHFWMVLIGVVIVNAIVGNLTYGPVETRMAMGQPGGFGPMAILGILISLGLLWIQYAAWVKRLHDRDKTWWWAVLMSAACFTIIGLLWPLIELGFLDGTPGANKYGPSPKGIGG